MGDLTTLTDSIQADDSFGEVMRDDGFELEWQISVDSGGTWETVGTSSNPLYVTYGEPSNPPYRTVVHVATVEAVGATNEPDVIQGVWDAFSERDVSTWDGSALTYDHQVPPPSSTPSLLMAGHGQCDAWADLFRDALRTHSITTGMTKKIKDDFPRAQGLLIENWDFGTPDSFVPDVPAEFKWRSGTNLTKEASIEGQNHTPDVHEFPYHRVYVIGTKIYDAAYGGPVYDDLAAWQAASLAGAYLYEPPGSTNQNDLYAKKDDGTPLVKLSLL